jgi:hypothetical protein
MDSRPDVIDNIDTSTAWHGDHHTRGTDDALLVQENDTNVVNWIFFILGCAVLLPWNCKRLYLVEYFVINEVLASNYCRNTVFPIKAGRLSPKMDICKLPCCSYSAVQVSNIGTCDSICEEGTGRYFAPSGILTDSYTDPSSPLKLIE